MLINNRRDNYNHRAEAQRLKKAALAPRASRADQALRSREEWAEGRQAADRPARTSLTPHHEDVARFPLGEFRDRRRLQTQPLKRAHAIHAAILAE